MSAHQFAGLDDMYEQVSAEPATILIVDDEPFGRDTLVALLQPQGYQLMLSGNGPDALEQAAARPPDLVLLDVMMPGMDGFEVCRRLRADPQLREVPVIMLTALDDRVSRLQGLEAGADDFISKPYDRAELRSRVRTITRLNRYRRLLAERANFARLVELAPDGMLIVGVSGAVVMANLAMSQLLGARQVADLLGQHITVFLAPEQRDEMFAGLRGIMSNPAGVIRRDAMFIRPGGVRLPAEIHAGYFIWEGQPAVQMIVRDISERKRAELLEEERRHIAYELHDGLAQIVTSAHQHMQAFAGRYRPRSALAREELSLALDLARRAVQEVRRVIGGLRPTALDDFGLAAALQMHVVALRADGLEVEYRETLGDLRLSPEIETVIFRVALEGLTNVRKHARTNRARLELLHEGASLRLIIQDWGCGFDPALLPASSRLGERIGLRGMRERIALLGGQYTIDSNLGGGTRIVAMVPLPSPEQGERPDEV